MPYIFHIIDLALIFSILALSLNLLQGYTGVLTMSQAAFFGVGAYVSAILAINLGLSSVLVLLIAIASAWLFGILVSFPVFRVKNDLVILLTLGIQNLVSGLIVTLSRVTGGGGGLSGIPAFVLFGYHPVAPVSFLPVILALFIPCVFVVWRTTHSAFGRVLKGIREDELATVALGKNIARFKLLVFGMSGALAAVGGYLFAVYTRFISPLSFSADQSILIVAMVVVGGSANVWGSILGAFLLISLPEALRFIRLSASGGQGIIGTIQAGMYGLLLILFVRFRPQGLVPEHSGFGTQNPPLESSDSYKEEILGHTNDSVRHDGDVTLEVKGLSKHFGGVTAVNDASFALREGKITALIGPNGAGKTTVFNLITGFIKPDAGSVYLYGLDITKLPPFSRARLGIVRTFQEVRFFKNLSVLDNVMLGCPKQDGEKLRFLFFLPRRVARQDRESIRRAMTSLNFVGLGDKARELAANLSFAEHKMLVLACALATGADILLLDEVASGTDPTAIDKELALIRRLAAFGKTICIVEHNLEIVSKLADFSYFLAQGRVIASGTPSELMSNDELVEMYFGRKAIAT